MSSIGDDLNPLSPHHQATAYHSLVAFEFSTAAYNFDGGPSSIGMVGESVPAMCGGAYVLMNEYKDPSVSMDTATTEWSFYSPRHYSTGEYVGVMEIIDRSAFKFNETLTKAVKQLETSVFHITFMWNTMFVVDKGNGTETINVAPMYFHVVNNINNFSAINGRSYYIEMVSAYASHAKSPQFSNLFNTTVTHKDGATINTIPTPVAPSSGIEPTSSETASKFSARKERLDKTKVMKTMEDFCDSFLLTLGNEYRKKHKIQLQEYLSLTRDGDYEKKIEELNDVTEPMVEYEMDCDPYYKPKKLDNRNMPFEQYEVDQSIPGISSITFPLGYTIHKALYSIFRSSKEIATDHQYPAGKTFKFISISERKCNSKYKIRTNIYYHTSPYNSSGMNTGPGDGVVDKPIGLTYQDSNAKDTNILSITYSETPEYELLHIEKNPPSPQTNIVLGDRELQTSAREIKGLNFFEYGFSGMKVARGAYTDNGMESAEIVTHLTNYNPIQQMTYSMAIRGNPNLLSDINRNPRDVNERTEGNAHIYKYVEYEPMYIKLQVFLEGDQKNQPPEAGTYQFDNYVHLYKIRNIFSGGGGFTQMLFCGRTDNKT